MEENEAALLLREKLRAFQDVSLKHLGEHIADIKKAITAECAAHPHIDKDQVLKAWYAVITVELDRRRRGLEEMNELLDFVKQRVSEIGQRLAEKFGPVSEK